MSHAKFNVKSRHETDIPQTYCEVSDRDVSNLVVQMIHTYLSMVCIRFDLYEKSKFR